MHKDNQRRKKPMIYGKPIAKPSVQQSITKKNPPPSRDKLYLYVANINNGQEFFIDLLEKEIKDHELPYRIEKYEENFKQKIKLIPLLTEGEQWLEKFITEDPSMAEMKRDAHKMAKCPHDVLVFGETGTGKELIAKSMIADRKGSIKCLNCAGFPSELIESELFGHTKGSFTDASSNKMGLFTAANEGVLFLDEIGEMPLYQQAKLLRALQDKKIRKVGSNVEEPITCKVVCATNRDLRKAVIDGVFRKDLYARISTLELEISPLKDRMCDVIPITKSLAGGTKFLEEYEKSLIDGILDLSNNVRSIQSHVISYNILGKVRIKN